MGIRIQKGGVNDDEFIDFIQYVFGFNGNDQSFYKLLPKLYGNGRTASDCNWFVVDENNKPLGAVGLYDIDYVIGEKHVRAKGIGNVAVHPRHRSKGYMIDCMNASLKDAIDSGAAMVVLGGVRHRYNHFGFEKCAPEYCFSVSPRSIRYVLGDYVPSLRIAQVKANDDYYLDSIFELQQKQPFHAVRNRRELYEILISWQSVPYVFLDEDTVVGYAIRAGQSVPDFYTDNPGYIDDMIVCMSEKCGSLSYEMPLFNNEINDRLSVFASSQDIQANECVNVLNWESILDAMMKLKASSGKMSEGSFVFEIDGYRAKETVELSFSGGVASAMKTYKAPDLKLSHLEAMDLFFAIYSSKRSLLPPEVASWIPFGLWICHTDNV